jgi:hypothetical protein
MKIVTRESARQAPPAGGEHHISNIECCPGISDTPEFTLPIVEKSRNYSGLMESIFLVGLVNATPSSCAKLHFPLRPPSADGGKVGGRF